jgi:hypothetical protein
MSGNTKFLSALETSHVPLWLLKDICWLMSFRLVGVIIAIPTVLVAMIMVVLTYKDRSAFLPNLSIALWIIANTNWMVAEFYEFDTKSYSLYPFIGGLLVFVVFLIQKLRKTDKIKHI